MERLRRLQAGDDERSELLRLAGGVLLAVGAYVLGIRTSSFGDGWAKFPELLVVAIPTAILLAGGLMAARAVGLTRPWHAVWVVLGLIGLPLSLFQLVDTLGGDSGASLNVAWVFGLTAAAGWAAGLRAVRFAWLIAGVSILVAWLAVWNEVISGGLGDDIGTFRALTMVIAAILLAAGLMLRDRDGEAGRVRLAEWSTAAGLVFVLGAGVLSLIGPIGGSLAASFGGLTGVDPGSLPGQPSDFWDSVLLAGSIGLVAAGTRFAIRGPVYVGAVGLLLFAGLVGSDLDDPTPEGTVFGWPVLLLVLAAGAVVLSLGELRNRIGAGEPPPPTG